MTDLTPFEQITHNINQLVNPYTNRELLTPIAARLQKLRYWDTNHPSLLDQLREAIHPQVAELDFAGGAFGSRPPTNTDALNALMRIESGAAWWLKVGYGRDLRRTAEDNLRALIGASTEPHRTRNELQDLAVDTSRWLTIARTESGWQPRPFAPQDDPCPAPVCTISGKIVWESYCSDHYTDDPTNFPYCCGITTCGRLTLRIRRPDADHAWCTHCGAAWSEHNPSLPSVLLLVDALTAQRGAA